MTIEIDEAIERYTSNAEYERTHGNLQGCLEFRQLAEWLRDYKRLKEQEPNTGHWIEKMDACECPYCHKAWDYCDNDTEDFDYCPKCGAKLSEIPTGSKDVIWYSKRNYSEIVVEPQESEG